MSYLEELCANLHRNLANIREHYEPYREDSGFILDTASNMETIIQQIEGELHVSAHPS